MQPSETHFTYFILLCGFHRIHSEYLNISVIYSVFQFSLRNFDNSDYLEYLYNICRILLKAQLEKLANNGNISLETIYQELIV